MRDAFICDGVRTPVGRYGGALSAVRADDLEVREAAGQQSAEPEIPAVHQDVEKAAAAGGELPGALHRAQPGLTTCKTCCC